MRLRAACCTVAGIALLATSPALAGQGKPKDTLGGAAKSAVTQPLQDLNLAGKKVPTELLLLREKPYATDGLDSCEAIDTQIASLEDILGPDVDAPQEGGGMLRSALSTGGKFLGGFIPFRGVVRQLSGASERKKRMEDAVYVGVARRSFLKGFAASKGCPTAEERAIAAARAALGEDRVLQD
ncbi:MAG: hypothetical protein R3D89_03155 [Sphingomonadaceae bacterium]